jgi:Cu(I)-responsive transcriptional regulator
MKIGDLARQTDTKVETIRFYEAEGLLPPAERNSHNYRIYTGEHLKRLSFIRRARDLGFTLPQVRALLRLADDRNAPCSQVDEITSEHISQVDRKIADLEALRTELVRNLESCKGATIADCQIIEALSPARKNA